MCCTGGVGSHHPPLHRFWRLNAVISTSTFVTELSWPHPLSCPLPCPAPCPKPTCYIFTEHCLVSMSTHTSFVRQPANGLANAPHWGLFCSWVPLGNPSGIKAILLPEQCGHNGCRYETHKRNLYSSSSNWAQADASRKLLEVVGLLDV